VTTLASTIQAFFTDCLARQRRASPHTVAAYRDSIRLLLAFAARQTGKQPSRLEITDLDAPLVGAFLDHLENERGNSIRTRNARLAAIHALFSYAALRHLECAAVIQRVTAIPPKRFDRKLVTYLTEPEAAALLAAPDTDTRTGRRDRALLTLAIQAGLRVSELTSLTRADVFLSTGAHVTCTGKGRKQRITPLTPATAKVLAAWLAEHPGNPDDPLFPSRPGTPMSRDAVERRLAKHAAAAAVAQPTLKGKENIASCHEAHRGHETAGSGDRHDCHRLVARARVGRHDPDLHSCRPRHQGKGTRPDSAPRRPGRTLPAPGRSRSVP
jgi:integrase/recombinase XerD